MPDITLDRDIFDTPWHIRGAETVLRNALWIDGIEVTQAIQYRRATWHLTDAADRNADNAARLVAYKAAWVRVYFRSLFDMTGITGTLEIGRRRYGSYWTHDSTLSPNPPGTAQSSYAPAFAAERATLASTLNFVVPAEKMWGKMRLKADVSAGTFEASHWVEIDASLKQTLKLAGIMVAYDGPASLAPKAPNLQIAAPDLADLQGTVPWTLTTFPVAEEAEFRNAGTVTQKDPLTDPAIQAGSCSHNWLGLNTKVAAQKTADGNRADWIYYGLLPVGTPIGPVGGCEYAGVSAGVVNAEVTMAHEIGHGCGLKHAPCGGVGASADASYPAYEPYDPANTPQASIGEYGLDIDTGTIHSPANAKDFMSYCLGEWMSLYHHGKLINNSKLNPVQNVTDLDWWKKAAKKAAEKALKYILKPETDWEIYGRQHPVHKETHGPADVISVIGTVLDGDLTVTHVARCRARPIVDGGTETALVARLLDENGAVLARAQVTSLTPGVAGLWDGPAVVQAFIPDVAPGSALDVVEGGRTVWSRHSPAEAIEITEFACKLQRDGRLKATWRAAAQSDSVDFWLRWSADGEEWQALATGLTGEAAEIDAGHLPPGRILVELVGHDGFSSATSERVTVEAPKRGPTVTVLHPRPGQKLIAGRTVRLACAATSADGAPVPGGDCAWSLGRGRKAGTGRELWIEAPPAGKHRVTLRVSDRYGTADAAVEFETVDDPTAD